MKTLYIECNMGAAGDMLMAALMELLPNPDEFLDKMNSIGLNDVAVRAIKAEKCGICGHRVEVSVCGIEEESIDVYDHEHHHEHEHEHEHEHDNEHHHHEHEHSSFEHITALIHSLDLPQKVKEKATEIYSLIAEAEAQVHGRPMEHVHFHEVGTMDAVCDIVGCCLALEMLSPDKIVVSPIHVGSGNVKCQHGILPVPAPATAYILRDIPIYGGEIKGELCTPTGAALLKAFAHTYGPMPAMIVEKIGNGMGKKDFERANCVRAFLGEAKGSCGEVWEISCNLDDITAEQLAFACGILFEEGALDVFTVPIVMKKGRAGHLLTVISSERNKDKLSKLMLKHTTTRGVRMILCQRLTLDAQFETVKTEYGDIDIKISSGFGILKVKPECDGIVTAAKLHGATFDEVQKTTLQAYNNNAIK